MLQNALIPVVTILGPALAGSGDRLFIIETMFGFPGMGRAYVQSIEQRDYSMIMGTTLIYAVPGRLGQSERGLRLRLPRSAHPLERVSDMT